MSEVHFFPGISSEPEVHETVLDAAAADITITGLNGDEDGDYDLEFYLVANGATGVSSLQPNGLTTNQRNSGNYAYSGGGATNVTYALLELISSSTDGQICVGTCHISARTGKPRIFSFVFMQSAETGGGQVSLHLIGVWSDTTTNLTSLTMHSATANGFAAGSYIRAVKR